MADPARRGVQRQIRAGQVRGTGVPRQVNASGFREGCCVAIRRRGSRFPAYRVAFGAAAPARGRDPCPPYPRNQSEMHRPNAPIETEQGSEWHPQPRSRASSTQHSPIARGHVGWGKPGLSTNPKRKVRTLAPTSAESKRCQSGRWGTGPLAKPAGEVSLPPPSVGTPVRAIVETRFGRLCCALGGRSWPADPL